MFQELEKKIAQLANDQAGWVTRRDAAQYLGKAATTALDALRAHADDTDTDVRQSARDALGWAAASLRGIKPAAQDRAYTLDELVKAAEKPGERVAEGYQDGFRIRVATKDGRKQDVFVAPHLRNDGTTLIRVFTRCGAPREDQLHWALETNMSLTMGALALTHQYVDEGEDEEFVLTKVFIASETTPHELEACVKELAYYGDWIEQKLTGTDEL